MLTVHLHRVIQFRFVHQSAESLLRYYPIGLSSVCIDYNKSLFSLPPTERIANRLESGCFKCLCVNRIFASQSIRWAHSMVHWVILNKCPFLYHFHSHPQPNPISSHTSILICIRKHSNSLHQNQTYPTNHSPEMPTIRLENKCNTLHHRSVCTSAQRRNQPWPKSSPNDMVIDIGRKSLIWQQTVE